MEFKEFHGLRKQNSKGGWFWQQRQLSLECLGSPGSGATRKDFGQVTSHGASASHLEIGHGILFLRGFVDKWTWSASYT